MKLLREQFLSRLMEQNLSVVQCATMAKIRPDTIYDNLRTPGRRPHFSTIWRLAQVLGCKINDIAEVREFVQCDEGDDV